MVTTYPKYPASIGERIRAARVARGLSQQELASRVDLTRPAISQIEGGKRGIDSVELVAISRTLQKPITFFLEEADHGEKRFSILFRADEISEKDHVVVEDFQDLCRGYTQLEALLGIERKSDIPTWNCSARNQREAILEGERTAKEARKVLSIGIGPISDISGLLENKGVRIWKSPLSQSKAWGFSVSSAELGWCIFVNSACMRARQSFTVAHEFGHLVMDHDHKASVYTEAASIELGRSPKDLHESRANAFAAAFLMPEEGLKEVLSRYHISSPKDMSAYVVDFLRQYYGVSYEAMLWRLLGLQLVSTAQREALRKMRPRAPEPAQATHVDHSLPSRYRTLALEAYRNAKISVGKLADLLREDLYDTRKMLKELALVQAE